MRTIESGLAGFHYRVAVALLAVAGIGLTGDATAQAPPEMDRRWTPFLGCWEPTSETAETGLLCVVPSGPGVEVFTWRDGEEVTNDLLLADGVAREAVIEGCEGSESSEFSSDGRRVFTRSEFNCGGDAQRESSGIMSMISPTEWVDVHSLDVEGERVAWVQRFHLADPDREAEEGLDDVTEGIGMAVRTARMVASRPVSFAEVAEAAGSVHAKAVEAWIASRGQPFDFNGGDLVALADGGVPASVVDVIVAVSYPDRFVIDGGGGGIEEASFDEGWRRNAGYGYYPGLYGPYGFRSFFSDPWGYGYRSPGAWGLYSSRSYYGGYGYGGYGYVGYGWPGYYGGGYYYPTRVVVQPRSSGGRVVKGRGYTDGSYSGGSVRPVGRSGAPWPSGGSSGGASVSGGSSGAKSPPSRGRTAKPRGRGR